MTRGHNRGHNRKYKGVNKRKKSSRLHFVRGKVAGHRTQVAPIVEKVWDQKKTLRQNYQALGLQGDVNRAISENSVRSKHPGKQSKDQAASASAQEGVEWVDLDSIPRPEDERSRRVAHNMSEEEQIYVSTLIERHGTDYKAMERDIKTNVYQWTASRLKRRCVRYNLLAEQVRKEAEAEAAAAATAAKAEVCTASGDDDSSSGDDDDEEE